MKYWKIMAARGSRLFNHFKENGIIAIGFVFTNEIKDAMTAEDIRDIFARANPEASQGRIISSGSQLFRFYHELQKGDRILVYEPTTRLYHIGEIISDVEFHQEEELPHVRQVKWLQTILRDTLTITTRNTLGAILTLFEVTENAKIEIDARLAGRVEQEDLVGDNEVSTLGEDFFERSQEFIKDTIVKLEWRQLQELVAGLLRAMGYKTRVSPPGPDRGKDIIASPDGLGLEEPRIVVEVKHRPDTQIGAPEVRGFAGGLRNAKGVYVSTGGFSREAHYEAERAQMPLLLIDIDELASLITQYYEQCDADTRVLLPLRKMYWPIS